MMHEVPFRRRLTVRVVLGLLLVAIIPLSVSFVLIGRIAEVAQNFSSHRVERLLPHLEKAQGRMHDLIRAKKELYAATLLGWALDPEVIARGALGEVPEARLSALLAEQDFRELIEVDIRNTEGKVLGSIPHTLPPLNARQLSFKQEIPGTGMALHAKFIADETLAQDIADIALERDTTAKIAALGGTLPEGYRTGFIILVGGVVVLVTAIGVILAFRIGRRIESLVAGTHKIGVGELTTRVKIPGGDELAYLSSAFNQMADRLEQDRDKIIYLERIGAWTEVARRLAHEIKNPLTPIRLAVQQTVSLYGGDDARFKKQLKDTEEIVYEEIDNLKRLVDAFTILGRLPRVEPKPLDLVTVIEDLEKDPAVAEFLERGASQGTIKVRGDRLLLRRLLTNLVENGHHAGVGAGKKGKVVVSWQIDRRKNQGLVTVDDEGPGLSGELRTKVFEPYFTTKETGSGLGLAIAKKIAIDHGGSLEISATPAPTGGARFILSLPLGDGD